MQPLKNILGFNMRKSGLANRIQGSLVVEFVKKLIIEDFGQQGAQRLNSISFKGGKIHISTNSSAFKQEISYKEQKYLKEIEAKFGSPIVKKFTYF